MKVENADDNLSLLGHILTPSCSILMQTRTASLSSSMPIPVLRIVTSMCLFGRPLVARGCQPVLDGLLLIGIIIMDEDTECRWEFIALPDSSLFSIRVISSEVETVSLCLLQGRESLSIRIQYSSVAHQYSRLLIQSCK
jgi:hypothetical protein